MSDALENKAVELLDKSQAAVATFADKLGEMAKQYGPDVADAALQIARVDAISGLVWPTIILLITSTFGTYCLIKAWRHTLAEMDKGEDIIGLGLLATIVWLFAVILPASSVFDVWRWVGIFEPKLWLAKRVLGL